MSAIERSGMESPEYYPYVTRSLLRLYGQGVLTNVTNLDIEPRYGYVTRITYTDGSHRITYGNDLGLNNGAASDLSRDKGHTKFMLRTIGINCPGGDEFLLPWWADEIGSNQRQHGNNDIRTTDQVEAYIDEELGYPVYVKPIDGSKGADIYKVSNPEELRTVLELYDEKRVRVAIVEEPLDMPDYRVVTLDDELISAYRRVPLSVTGDGSSTIRELIAKLQECYDDEGRDTRLDPDDPRISQYLSTKERTIEDIPDSDEEVVLVATSNLSAGGTSEDVTDIISPHWVDLSTYVAKNFNLRLIGLDVACQDITDPEADYSVIEVNGAPGLDHYASSGEVQARIVDGLYTKVLNALPIKR